MTEARFGSKTESIKRVRSVIPRSWVLLLLAQAAVVCADSVAFSQLDSRRRTDVIARPVTVRDAIEMTTPGAYSARAQFSLDDQNLVIVVKKGSLANNTVQYSMLLWRSAEVFSHRSPRLLVTMSSSSNRPAIGSISWLPDNETLAFIGENPGETQQLYTYNIRTATLKQVTHHPTNVRSYSITSEGTTVAFAAEAAYRKIYDETTIRLGKVVST